MYAGFWKRFLAYLIDLIILYIGLLVILGVLVLFAYATGLYDNMVFLILYIVFALLITTAFSLGYYAVFEASKKQATPGKMALGIIVTDINGQRITMLRSLGRTLSKIVSGMTYGVGFLMAGFTVRKQALHDKIVETLVLDKNADINNLAPLPAKPWWHIALIITAVMLPLLLLYGGIVSFSIMMTLKTEKEKTAVNIVSNELDTIAHSQNSYYMLHNTYASDFESLKGGFGNGTSYPYEGFEVSLDNGGVSAARAKGPYGAGYNITRCYRGLTCCSGHYSTCKELGLTYSREENCCG